MLGAAVLGRAGSLFFPKLSAGLESGPTIVARNPHLSGIEMVGIPFELALFEAGCLFIGFLCWSLFRWYARCCCSGAGRDPILPEAINRLGIWANRCCS